ncbi:MAG: NAD(P)H-hydrate dehydratase [Hyphomicrobium sp.]
MELLTTAETAEADRLAGVAGVTSLALMENAGRAVAEASRGLVSGGGSVLVVAGPGNNGGDGFVAARHLAMHGVDVSVALIQEASPGRGDAAEMRRRWQGSVCAASPELVRRASVVIDAAFGAGLSRPLAGLASDMIDAINGGDAAVLSVDVPSGLDGSTGQALGAVVRATRTVTFFRKKPGHLLLPGRMLCGDVIVSDIGIPSDILTAIAPQTFENAPDLWSGAYPWPRLEGHKYVRGHAIVASGPANQTGASRLGARGALRVGAGLVTLIGSPAATAINAAHETAVMVCSVSGEKALRDFLKDQRRNAVLIGPGATCGIETAADVQTVLQSPAAVVLDADALTSFEAADGLDSDPRRRFGFLSGDVERMRGPDALFEAIASRKAPVVLTPHEGEFKRLFGAARGDKLARARGAAKLSGATIVLKGADTVIASPDGRAAINANAPPWLATAGSGDVLAGFVAGLLAQGMPAFEAACAAVWLHGAAAQRFGVGLIAEDLPDAVTGVLSALYSARES